MFAKSIITFLTLAAAATATLNPATSNTKGKYPSKPGCSGPSSTALIKYDWFD